MVAPTIINVVQILDLAHSLREVQELLTQLRAVGLPHKTNLVGEGLGPPALLKLDRRNGRSKPLPYEA